MDASGAIMSDPKKQALPSVARPVSGDIDVKAIRLAAGIGATQATFADAIGVPVKTVRNWEQGRRKPTGPALILLSLLRCNPRIVCDVLSPGDLKS